MTTYVYFPYNGAFTSKYAGSAYSCACESGSGNYWKYCSDSSCHPCVYGSSPIDLDTPDETWIDFLCDSSCRSVIGVQHNGIMCSGSPGSPYDNMFELKMYSGTGGSGTYLGSFCYGHCDATFTTPAIDTVAIGGGLWGLTQVALVKAGNISGCYAGSHVHMECVGVSYVNTSYNCSSGPSWVYGY